LLPLIIHSKVFAVKFSPDDGAYLAACCGDGAIRVFNTSTGRLSYNLQTGSAMALPSTAVKFRPNVDGVKTKNVLIAADAVGVVEHWHMTSGKCLHTFQEVSERGEKRSTIEI
jgi:COMPASS component SWD3